MKLTGALHNMMNDITRSQLAFVEVVAPVGVRKGCEFETSFLVNDYEICCSSQTTQKMLTRPVVYLPGFDIARAN